VFSVKYLETGLRYNFLKGDIHIWVRNFIFAFYLPYVATICGSQWYLAIIFPVNDLPSDTSLAKCFKAGEAELANILTFANKVRKTSPPIHKLHTWYFYINVVLCLIGTGLIYYANRNILLKATTAIKVNWIQYVAHFLALVTLAVLAADSNGRHVKA
jgi:hypothetical protein